jgi:hypothetical protein
VYLDFGMMSSAPAYARFAIMSHVVHLVNRSGSTAGPSRAELANSGVACRLRLALSSMRGPQQCCHSTRRRVWRAVAWDDIVVVLLCVASRDYNAMCKDYYTLQFMDPSIDTSPIAPALQVSAA